jgi:thiosulfate/3-mercaptopyruvate sulfurtransferase
VIVVSRSLCLGKSILMKVLRVHVKVGLVLAIAILARSDEASSTRPILVSHDALRKRLFDSNVRLLDARTRVEYDQGHIPGAVWVSVKAAGTLAARQGGLTDRDAWEAWIAPLGIEPRMEVLVYDGKQQLDAARIWWLLRYLGIDRAGLIDGNFPLWQRANHPVSTEPHAVSARPFPITFRRRPACQPGRCSGSAEGPQLSHHRRSQPG